MEKGKDTSMEALRRNVSQSGLGLSAELPAAKARTILRIRMG